MARKFTGVFAIAMWISKCLSNARPNTRCSTLFQHPASDKTLTSPGPEVSFEEMAVELGMTVEEADDFGTRFFDRAFVKIQMHRFTSDSAVQLHRPSSVQ